MTQLYEITIEERRLRVARIRAESRSEAEAGVLAGRGAEQFNQCFQAQVVKALHLGRECNDLREKL